MELQPRAIQVEIEGASFRPPFADLEVLDFFGTNSLGRQFENARGNVQSLFIFGLVIDPGHPVQDVLNR